MYEDTDIIAASLAVVRAINFDTWLSERERFAPIVGPDFLGVVELAKLEALLTGRAYGDIPLSDEIIPPEPTEAPTSEEDLPLGFATPVRRKLQDLLAALPPEKVPDVGRAWAAIEEFPSMPEREVTEWFLPFFHQFIELARTAREEDLDLFVVSWD